MSRIGEVKRHAIALGHAIIDGGTVTYIEAVPLIQPIAHGLKAARDSGEYSLFEQEVTRVVRQQDEARGKEEAKETEARNKEAYEHKQIVESLAESARKELAEQGAAHLKDFPVQEQKIENQQQTQIAPEVAKEAPQPQQTVQETPRTENTQQSQWQGQSM